MLETLLCPINNRQKEKINITSMNTIAYSSNNFGTHGLNRELDAA